MYLAVTKLNFSFSAKTIFDFICFHSNLIYCWGDWVCTKACITPHSYDQRFHFIKIRSLCPRAKLFSLYPGRAPSNLSWYILARIICYQAHGSYTHIHMCIYPSTSFHTRTRLYIQHHKYLVPMKEVQIQYNRINIIVIIRKR